MLYIILVLKKILALVSENKIDCIIQNYNYNKKNIFDMTQTVRQRTDSTRNLPAAILKGAAANLAIQAIGKSKISNLLIKF